MNKWILPEAGSCRPSILINGHLESYKYKNQIIKKSVVPCRPVYTVQYLPKYYVTLLYCKRCTVPAEVLWYPAVPLEEDLHRAPHTPVNTVIYIIIFVTNFLTTASLILSFLFWKMCPTKPDTSRLFEKYLFVNFTSH